MFGFLTCTWVWGYISRGIVEPWQKDCCALHRPLTSDNLVLSSVLGYKKDHVNVVLWSDAWAVVKECLGPGWYLSRREGKVPAQGGLRCEALPLLFPRRLFHSGFLLTLPKGFTYMASLIHFTTAFGTSLGNISTVVVVECLVTLILHYFSHFSRECMTSQGAVAQGLVQRVPCDCCRMKGRREQLAKLWAGA